MDPTTDRIRILHISDLHLDSRSAWHDSWRPVRSSAWADNLKEILREGPIDLVCITGDIILYGQSKEYEQATVFLKHLLDRLGVGLDRVMIVPGNHDIDRSIEHEAWRALRGALTRGVDEASFSRWIADRAHPPPGFSNVWRERVLLRQHSYRNWVRSALGRDDLDPRGSAHGRLGYRVSLRGRWAFPIHVIGFDTAWLSGDDKDHGSLRLTEHQPMMLASAHGEPLRGLRIALMHHPFHALADDAACRQFLADSVDLVLHGHEHRSDPTLLFSPNRRIPCISAGSLREGDWLPTRFNVVSVEADEHGWARRIEVRSRAWSARAGRWYDDSSLTTRVLLDRPARSPLRSAPEIAAEHVPVARDGQHADRVGDPNPYDPWSPVRPERLVGRSEIVEKLVAALDDGWSATLLGTTCIGKTSIIEAVCARLRDKHPIAYARGTGPASVSSAAFVEAVTGEPARDDPDAAARTLERWTRAQRGRPVIAIDDADVIFARLEPRFVARLAGLSERLSLLVASTRGTDVWPAAEELSRSLGGRRITTWVGLLDQEAPEAIIGWGAHALERGDAVLMREQAGRHPFFLQLLGKHLVDARLRAEPDAAETALARFREDASRSLHELWTELDDWEQDALRDAAAGTPVRRTKRLGAWLTERGEPFGRVLVDWLSDPAVLRKLSLKR